MSTPYRGPRQHPFDPAGRAAILATALVLLVALLQAPAGAAHPRTRSGFGVFDLELAFPSPPTASHALQVAVPGSDRWVTVGSVDPGGPVDSAFALDRSRLATDGSIRLRWSHPTADDGWAYLLPSGLAGAARAHPATDLRADAIAYLHLASVQAIHGHWGYARLSQTSHAVIPTFDGGRISSLALDGVGLGGAGEATSATGGLRFDGSSSDHRTTTLRFTQGSKNPLTVEVSERGDRLGFAYTYSVAAPLSAAVEVAARLRLPGSFTRLESLRTYPVADDVTMDPTVPLAMSNAPLVLARDGDGRYVGALDRLSSGLVAAMDRTDNELRLEMWLWPSKARRTYRWTFDMVAGYEGYYAALLRAMRPYTTFPSQQIQGGMASRYCLDSPATAERAYRAGARVIWLHGWWYRNGLYFEPTVRTDRTYTSIWADRYSYRRLAGQVATAHAAGLQAYVYIQFAGISQDVTGRFASGVLTDRNADQVIAGTDGPPRGRPIRNVWADADPALAYGRSILGQVARLSDVVHPDGIALDRTDRRWLDDFSSFDGYASPPYDASAGYRVDPTAHPSEPVARTAVEGGRFVSSLYAIVNERGGRLLTNVPIAPTVFGASAGVKTDQPLTPADMFFMRAMANGRAYFVQDRNEYPGATARSKGRDNVFLATLVRGQPFLMNAAWGGCASNQIYRFTGTIENSRLMYVIPSSETYPTDWLFSDGTAVIQYDGSQVSTLDRYAGSAFVPWP